MTPNKEFGELSQFAKRDVELFRSSDPHNTAIYFTEVPDKERETAKAFFELLRFGLDGGDHQVYVRFPNTDYFVEMIDGGTGSAHGNMMEAHGADVWSEPYDMSVTPFTIYSQGDNLIFVMGFLKFNFMTKVAEYNKGNPYVIPYPQETSLNYAEIELALKRKYLKLPEDIRTIVYLFKDDSLGKSLPTYFIVDCPAYNFRYDNMRFRTVHNNISLEYKVEHFTRYKDGGTTRMTVSVEMLGSHEFFCPQTMFPADKELFPTWDGIKLKEVSKEEREAIVSLLKMELAPVLEEEKM